LASVGRNSEAIENLAFLRKENVKSQAVIHEMAEIEAVINEEREARLGLTPKAIFFGKGNFVRFIIAFVIFFLQQWGGQNSIKYVILGYTDTLMFILNCITVTTHRRSSQP
jgi:Sugar (and other) transporter